MDTMPRAVLVHAIRGRARLRFDLQTGDDVFFDALAQALAELPGVLELRVTPATGSLLLLHEGDVHAVLDEAEARKLFIVAEPAPRALMRGVRSTIDVLDDRVAAETGDALSLGKVAFVALVGAGIWQSSTGFMLPAGLSIFDYAFKVMNWVADREPTMLQPRRDRVAGS